MYSSQIREVMFGSPSLWERKFGKDQSDVEWRQENISWKQTVVQAVMHESSLLKENLTVLKEEAEVTFFVVGWRFLNWKQVKDGEIEELTREIQMYYGIKRHIEELTKENQVFCEQMKTRI